MFYFFLSSFITVKLFCFPPSALGFVQYVESVSVREVSDTEGSILNFFRKHHPSETGPYGIAADVMDSYIRSCGMCCLIISGGSMMIIIIFSFGSAQLDTAS